MRPVNLFLTKGGVLKLGYYGLTSQAECFSIKEEDCDGIRSFAPEVFEGDYGMERAVWSLGIALIEMMGITPYARYNKNRLPTRNLEDVFPCTEHEIKSAYLTYFLKKCFEDVDERWSVMELMKVSGME